MSIRSFNDEARSYASFWAKDFVEDLNVTLENGLSDASKEFLILAAETVIDVAVSEGNTYEEASGIAARYLRLTDEQACDALDRYYMDNGMCDRMRSRKISSSPEMSSLFSDEDDVSSLFKNRY